jgi:predicted TIM-barrel fold metal-dependent hydrolase
MDGPVMMRPLGEVEFANGVGAMAASGTYGPCRACAAIVGYADLRFGKTVGEMLDRAIALAPERFRGVRQVTVEHPSDTPFRYMTNRPPSGVLSHPEFRSGVEQLAVRGLSFDAAVFHIHLTDIAALADAFPHMPIALNHLGMAMAMEMSAAERAEVYIAWESNLRDLARRQNVYCKLGGLGMPFWGFRFEQRGEPLGYLELATTWRPFVETAIDAFGFSRCMVESNFPPDGRSCGFVPLFNALKHIVRNCSASEKATLFYRTAMQFYRLNLDPRLFTATELAHA